MSNTAANEALTTLDAGEVAALRATNSAFGALVIIADMLNRAMNKGQGVEFSCRAGTRELEPEVGPDGRKWQRSEHDGGAEIRLVIKPLKPGEAPCHPPAGVV